MRVVPFDVPGHKHGRGNPELTAFLGEQCVGIDVNSMKPLDNLCHPVSVIRAAELLAAEAFGAASPGAAGAQAAAFQADLTAAAAVEALFADVAGAPYNPAGHEFAAIARRMEPGAAAGR